MAYPVDEDEMLFMYTEGAIPGFWIGVYDVSFKNVWVTVDIQIHEPIAAKPITVSNHRAALP